MHRLHRTLVLLFGLMLAAACATDDEPQKEAPLDPPPPYEGEDFVTFRVYTLDADSPPGKGSHEQLRWKGNGDGPAPDSPEATVTPWIGYGVPFRMEWEVGFEDAPLAGYKVKVSQDSNGPFLPRGPGGASFFGDVTEFSFANEKPPTGLPLDCDGGLDCPELRRFESGTIQIELIAQNEEGVLSDEELGLLDLEINYPPETSILRDEPGCDDEALFPHYVLGPVVCTIAEGDTIPAGSIVSFRVDGMDRFEADGFPDGICCDEPGQAGPEVRFQSRVELEAQHDLGTLENWRFVFGPPTESTLLTFQVGPFDYCFVVRAMDEHDRRDDSSSHFDFVAGFPPHIVSITPGRGQRLLLRDPSRGGRWAENEIEYSVSTGFTREWDRVARRYVSAPNDDTFSVSGSWVSFSPEFIGAADPREASAQAKEYFGGIRSWAYELVGEFDPGNSISDGGGSDELTRFDDSPQINRWKFSVPEAVRIFVPDLVWESLELMDPEGDCPDPALCDLASELRKQLGTMTLDVVGKTTRLGSTFGQSDPRAPGANVESRILDLGRLGRRTRQATQTFSVRLGIADEGGALEREWPAP